LNKHPAHGRLDAGEHIIYVGGCFLADYDEFKGHALFFGHRFPDDNFKPLVQHEPRIIKSLGAWMGGLADPIVTSRRTTVRQP
jgi:hypothetical protein